MTDLPDIRERERATSAVNDSLIIEASAGTGKTTTIIRRIVTLLTTPRSGEKEPLRLSEIVAITFTDRAAQELKDRLRAELYRAFPTADDANADRIRQALGDLEQAPIGTIHSFCSRILREYPIEAGVDVQFDMFDATQADELRASTWDEWLSGELAQPELPPVFRQLSTLGVRLPAIRDVAFELLNHRAQGVADALRRLDAPPVDWTSAIQELRVVIDELTIPKSDIREKYGIKSIQGKYLENLRRFCDKIETAQGLERDRLVLGEMPFGKTSIYATPVREIINRLRDAISAPIIRDLIDWLAPNNGSQRGFLSAYEAAKAEHGVLDFDDLLIRARDLVRDVPDARRKLHDTYRALVVDEFQDTDPVQAELIVRLAQADDAGDDWSEISIAPRRLCVVGDPKQSIYRFRGADVETYSRVGNLLDRSASKNTSARCVLETNFRSHPSIIDAVNHVFGAAGVFRDAADTTGSSFHPVYAPLKPPPDFSTDDTTQRRVLRLTDDGDAANADERRARESAVIVATIQQAVDEGWPVRDPITGHVRPLQFGDVAILYRAATGIEHLETALQNAALPYYQIGGKHFYQREETTRLISVLSAIEQPNDALSVVAALRSLFFGVSDTDLFRTKPNFDYRNAPSELPDTVQRAYEILRELHTLRRESRPSAVVQRLFDCTKVLSVYAHAENGDQAVANLLKILDDARRLEATDPMSFRRFHDHLRRMREDAVTEGEAAFTAHDDTGGGRVHLLTIHKAKGLEFPVVCVFDLAAGKGRGPNISATMHAIQNTAHEHSRIGMRIGGDSLHVSTPGFERLTEDNAARGEAESKRLLYVALTRARDYLLLPAIASKKSGVWAQIIDSTPQADMWERFTPRKSPQSAIQLPTDVEMTIEELDAVRSHFETSRQRLPEKADEPRVHFRRPSMHSDERDSFKDSIADDDRTRDDAQRLGTVVHAALEHALSKRVTLDEIELRAIVDACADECRLASRELRNEAVTLTRRGLSMGVVHRAVSAKRMWTEVPVTLCEPDESGHGIAISRGICDLVFTEGDGLVLVDYKTDRFTARDTVEDQLRRKVETYREQVGTYVRALIAATELPVVEAWLVFLAAANDGAECLVPLRSDGG